MFFGLNSPLHSPGLNSPGQTGKSVHTYAKNGSVVSFISFLSPSRITTAVEDSSCKFPVFRVSSVAYVEIFQYPKTQEAAKTILATAKFAVEATATVKHEKQQ